MNSGENILRRWHNRLSDSTRKGYLDTRIKYGDKIKPHSLLLVFAIGFTVVPLSLMSFIRVEHPFGDVLFGAFKAVMVFVSLVLYGAAYYEWRAFSSLKQSGAIKDRNHFFAESAGIARKLLFFAALVVDFVRKGQIILHPEDIGQQMRRLKFQTALSHYQNAAGAIIASVAFAILFVEILRLFSPKTSAWSDRKHMAVVSSMSLLVSGFRVFALHLARG